MSRSKIKKWINYLGRTYKRGSDLDREDRRRGRQRDRRRKRVGRGGAIERVESENINALINKPEEKSSEERV